VRWVLLIFAIVIAIPIGGLIVLSQVPYPYSRDHPDYDRYRAEIARMHETGTLNLAELNEGNWTDACLFGGYSTPSKTMKDHGELRVLDTNEVLRQLKNAFSFRLAEVEEFEAMIAYVDPGGTVEAIHFEPVGLHLQNFERCTTRETPGIVYQ